MRVPAMTDVRIGSGRMTVDPYWASAGIVDARAFSIGESSVVHAISHASPNLVRGVCGVTAHCVERDGRLAYWRNAYPDCENCKKGGQR